MSVLNQVDSLSLVIQSLPDNLKDPIMWQVSILQSAVKQLIYHSGHRTVDSPVLAMYVCIACIYK